MSLPRVLVVSLGGTITMSGGKEGVVPTLSADDLVAAVPGLKEVAALDAQTFLKVPGAHLGLGDIVRLASHIAARPDADGIVVIQGTDTMEETAFALDMLVGPARPVVVTGAMRNPTLPGADGPANLLAAVRVAGCLAMRGMGATVVMNDEIHAARYVQKSHATNPSAFASEPFGPIGFISENAVVGIARPVALPPFGDLRAIARAPRVAHLVSGIGDDGGALVAALEQGYDAVVLEATGGGHVGPSVAEAVSAVSARKPVLVSTRTRRGATLTGTYGFVGGEIDLRNRGAIFSGILDPVKARIALSLFLAQGKSRQDIAAWFEEAGMPRF